MILLTILVLTLLLLGIIVVATVSAIGAAGIILFGDVIVCAVFIVLLIKFLIKRKNRKHRR